MVNYSPTLWNQFLLIIVRGYSEWASNYFLGLSDFKFQSNFLSDRGSKWIGSHGISSVEHDLLFAAPHDLPWQQPSSCSPEEMDPMSININLKKCWRCRKYHGWSSCSLLKLQFCVVSARSWTNPFKALKLNTWSALNFPQISLCASAMATAHTGLVAPRFTRNLSKRLWLLYLQELGGYLLAKVPPFKIF